MAGEKSLLRSLTCQHDERFDTVCVAFKCLASQVEEEVLCRGCGSGPITIQSLAPSDKATRGGGDARKFDRAALEASRVSTSWRNAESAVQARFSRTERCSGVTSNACSSRSRICCQRSGVIVGSVATPPKSVLYSQPSMYWIASKRPA